MENDYHEARRHFRLPSAETLRWQVEMHEGHRRWIEEIKERNRARAAIAGLPALVFNPETGTERMEGLRPGQTTWCDLPGKGHLFFSLTATP